MSCRLESKYQLKNDRMSFLAYWFMDESCMRRVDTYEQDG